MPSFAYFRSYYRLVRQDLISRTDRGKFHVHNFSTCTFWNTLQFCLARIFGMAAKRSTVQGRRWKRRGGVFAPPLHRSICVQMTQWNVILSRAPLTRDPLFVFIDYAITAAS